MFTCYRIPLSLRINPTFSMRIFFFIDIVFTKPPKASEKNNFFCSRTLCKLFQWLGKFFFGGEPRKMCLPLTHALPLAHFLASSYRKSLKHFVKIVCGCKIIWRSRTAVEKYFGVLIFYLNLATVIHREMIMAEVEGNLSGKVLKVQKKNWFWSFRLTSVMHFKFCSLDEFNSRFTDPFYSWENYWSISFAGESFRVPRLSLLRELKNRIEKI